MAPRASSARSPSPSAKSKKSPSTSAKIKKHRQEEEVHSRSGTVCSKVKRSADRIQGGDIDHDQASPSISDIAIQKKTTSRVLSSHIAHSGQHSGQYADTYQSPLTDKRSDATFVDSRTDVLTDKRSDPLTDKRSDATFVDSRKTYLISLENPDKSSSSHVDSNADADDNVNSRTVKTPLTISMLDDDSKKESDEQKKKVRLQQRKISFQDNSLESLSSGTGEVSKSTLADAMQSIAALGYKSQETATVAVVGTNSRTSSAAWKAPAPLERTYTYERGTD